MIPKGLPPNALLAVDLDGTLCKSEYWGQGSPVPIVENIEVIKKLYFNGYHIIIYTARHPDYRMRTEHWLRENDVWYHALVMGERKMGADLYIDDKAIHTSRFFGRCMWRHLENNNGVDK